MKIKRVFAPNVRQAINKIRAELGEDAVILSNRKVNGGVEVVAAIDYDPHVMGTDSSSEPAQRAAARHQAAGVDGAPRQERPQLVWSQEPTLIAMRNELESMRGLLESQFVNLMAKETRARHPLYFELRQRLARLGFNTRLIHALLEQAPKDGALEDAWRQLLGMISGRLQVTNDDILSHGGVIALIGPTGVGKTTTLAKLAARFAMRHGVRSVALISTDGFRIGAHEQIKAYARILDVPVRAAATAEELRRALDHFCDKRLVLIDTAGMSQRDLRLPQQANVLMAEADRVRTYLVMAATSRLSGLDEVVRSYQVLKPQACIITKLDESACFGHALGVAMQHDLPIAYVTDGQRVPEDLQLARAHSLVARSVAMMQDNIVAIDNELPDLKVGEVGG